MIEAVLAPTSIYASGTLSTNVGSEDFLSSPNVVGTFRLLVDLSALLSGDVLELRAYQMVLTSGTSRPGNYMRYEGPQQADDLIKVSELVGNNLTDTNAVRFSIFQTKGSSRSIPWTVLLLG